VSHLESDLRSAPKVDNLFPSSLQELASPCQHAACMNFSTHKTASGLSISRLHRQYVTSGTDLLTNRGFLLPSIHSAPPFFTSVLLFYSTLHHMPSSSSLILKNFPYADSNRIPRRRQYSRNSGPAYSWLMPAIAACSCSGSRMRRCPAAASGTRCCEIRGLIVGHPFRHPLPTSRTLTSLLLSSVVWSLINL
jgi:hypothetical protein